MHSLIDVFLPRIRGDNWQISDTFFPILLLKVSPLPSGLSLNPVTNELFVEQFVLASKGALKAWGKKSMLRSKVVEKIMWKPEA